MTTVETARSKSKTSEALSTRSMVTSIVFHTLVLLLLLLVPAKMLLPRRASKKEVDVVFYRAPKIEVPKAVVPVPAGVFHRVERAIANSQFRCRLFAGMVRRDSLGI